MLVDSSQRLFIIRKLILNVCTNSFWYANLLSILIFSYIGYILNPPSLNFSFLTHLYYTGLDYFDKDSLENLIKIKTLKPKMY